MTTIGCSRLRRLPWRQIVTSRPPSISLGYSTKSARAPRSGKQPRSQNDYEDDQIQKIERENEIWKLRCSASLSSLPPALPVVCRKGKGQHLLKNSHIVDAIVERADVRSDDVVLEIGPGTGNLTLRLLETAKKVIAVEVDPRMVEELQRRVQLTELAEKLEIIKGDIMRINLPKFDICVANIPYKISSPLTFKLLSHAERFRSAVLMLQREFARRLLATSGDPHFCRLSVNTQLLADVNVLMEVSKANFSPPPKVDSTVIRITPRPQPLPVDQKQWDNFIRICFSRKNKTLGAIFRQKHVILHLAGHHSPWLRDSDEESDGEHHQENICKDKSDTKDDDMVLDHANLIELKQKVIDILSMGGFENRRSVKLQQGDFIKLLLYFTEAGIKFS